MAKKNLKNNISRDAEISEDLTQSDGKINKLINKLKSTLTLKRIIIFSVIIIIVIGVLILKLKKAKNGTNSTTVKKGTVTEDLLLSGDIQAEKHVKMTFPVSGKIAWVGVSEGDRVKKGQALSSIDTTTLDTAYQQARATLRKYEATVDYIHDTLKNKSSSETFSEKDTRTTAETNKDYAYDAFRAAEYNLKNATLIAPFEGIITSIGQTSPGVNILFSETQIELLDPATIYFAVTADQSEIINIQKGQKALVILDSFPDKNLEGKVSFVGLTPKEGESSTVYEIKITFDNSNFDTNHFKISMTGDAKFILSQKENALYLPSNFIHSDKKGKYIFLNSKKNKVYVETGLEGEENTEITKGAKEGDTILN